MIEAKTESNTVFDNQLYNQYNWYYHNFLPKIQAACDEFFSELFLFNLISVSKNINVLFQGNDYFVTKIRIDKQHDVFFRCSDEAIKVILDNVLGESKKKFQLNNITELEAKIISSFNDYLFNNISSVLLPPPPKHSKRKNFEMINLTFFIKDKSDKCGKFIISLPEVLLAPESVIVNESKFDVSHFNKSKIDVNIKVGTTTFPISDLKNLEKDDVVIFENSHIKKMQLFYKDYKKEFKVVPNLGLVTSIDNNNGGNNMKEDSLSQNLWDNIQVEMGAEFETVKISLGELKNIEHGVVIDIASVYDNKISLKVEDKTIAKGDLVIINDRYGVRVDEVFASGKAQPAIVEESEPHSEQTEPQEQESSIKESLQEMAADDEEEFDYSDFELDDEDI